MVEPLVELEASVVLLTVNTPAAETVRAVLEPIVVMPEAVARFAAVALLSIVPTYSFLAIPTPPSIIVEPEVELDASVVLLTVNTPAADIVNSVLDPI